MVTFLSNSSLGVLSLYTKPIGLTQPSIQRTHSVGVVEVIQYVRTETEIS